MEITYGFLPSLLSDGSGQSTLLQDTLYKLYNNKLNNNIVKSIIHPFIVDLQEVGRMMLAVRILYNIIIIRGVGSPRRRINVIFTTDRPPSCVMA